MSAQQAAGSSLPLLVLTAGMMNALRIEPQNPVYQERNNLTLTCYGEDECEKQKVMWTFPTDIALIGKQMKREKGYVSLNFPELSMLHDGARFRCSAHGCKNFTVPLEVRISIFSPPKDFYIDLPKSPLQIGVEVCSWCNVIEIHPMNNVQIGWYLGNTSNPLETSREMYSSSRISSKLCFIPKGCPS
uniref:Ig-like domain-containing protein n=1 Tax=Eptatretus burgeri TaxID=7764 RepID=A0A8C4QCJ3_EPTBU